MLPLNTEPNRKILPFVPLSLNVRCSKTCHANALLGPPDVVFRILSADEAKRRGRRPFATPEGG